METNACEAVAWFCAVKVYAPDPLLFAATGGLAAVTWRLVTRTNNLASEAALSASLADQAHQEQLMPICHFVGHIAMVFVGKDSSDNEVSYSAETDRPLNFRLIRTDLQLTGQIRNDGPGTALNVSLAFCIGFRDRGRIMQFMPIGVLAPAAGVMFSNAFTVWPPRGDAPLNAWFFEISALNIFNQGARTLHGGAFINGTIINIDSPGLSFEAPTSINRIPQRRIGLIGRLANRIANAWNTAWY